MITKKYEIFSSFGSLCGCFDELSYQRIIINEHVHKIQDYIEKAFKNKETLVLGVLDLGFYNGKFYVIDGQHRLKAIELLFFEKRIFVEIEAIVYTVSTPEEMREIFFLRNQHEPPPDFIRSENDEKKALLNNIHLHLVSLGRKRGFNNSKNRPNVNITGFIDLLSKSKMMDLVESIEDFEHLFEFLNGENQMFFSDLKNRRRYQVSDLMMRTAETTNNYISLRKFIEFEDGYDLKDFKRYLDERRTVLV